MHGFQNRTAERRSRACFSPTPALRGPRRGRVRSGGDRRADAHRGGGRHPGGCGDGSHCRAGANGVAGPQARGRVAGFLRPSAQVAPGPGIQHPIETLAAQSATRHRAAGAGSAADNDPAARIQLLFALIELVQRNVHAPWRMPSGKVSGKWSAWASSSNSVMSSPTRRGISSGGT